MDSSSIFSDKRTLCQFRAVGLREAIDALGSALPVLPAELGEDTTDSSSSDDGEFQCGAADNGPSASQFGLADMRRVTGDDAKIDIGVTAGAINFMPGRVRGDDGRGVTLTIAKLASIIQADLAGPQLAAVAEQLPYEKRMLPQEALDAAKSAEQVLMELQLKDGETGPLYKAVHALWADCHVVEGVRSVLYAAVADTGEEQEYATAAANHLARELNQREHAMEDSAGHLYRFRLWMEQQQTPSLLYVAKMSRANAQQPERRATNRLLTLPLEVGALVVAAFVALAQGACDQKYPVVPRCPLGLHAQLEANAEAVDAVLAEETEELTYTRPVVQGSPWQYVSVVSEPKAAASAETRAKAQAAVEAEREYEAACEDSAAYDASHVDCHREWQRMHTRGDAVLQALGDAIAMLQQQRSKVSDFMHAQHEKHVAALRPEYDYSAREAATAAALHACQRAYSDAAAFDVCGASTLLPAPRKRPAAAEAGAAPPRKRPRRRCGAYKKTIHSILAEAAGRKYQG